MPKTGRNDAIRYSMIVCGCLNTFLASFGFSEFGRPRGHDHQGQFGPGSEFSEKPGHLQALEFLSQLLGILKYAIFWKCSKSLELDNQKERNPKKNPYGL